MPSRSEALVANIAKVDCMQEHIGTKHSVFAVLKMIVVAALGALVFGIPASVLFVASFGLPELSGTEAPVQAAIEAQPKTFAEWDSHRQGEAHPATLAQLRGLYAPFNAALREMLLRDGTSCSTESDCDAFLWK